MPVVLPSMVLNWSTRPATVWMLKHAQGVVCNSLQPSMLISLSRFSIVTAVLIPV